MTGIAVEEIVMSFEASADIESIYKTIYQGDGSEVQLIDRLPENKNVHDEVVNTMVIHELIDGLSENEKKIIKMRYFEERTQTDIAVELGISQVQVSRLEKRILAAMREKIS
jgi:RNA polymerase sporulation-specific sigma factor